MPELNQLVDETRPPVRNSSAKASWDTLQRAFHSLRDTWRDKENQAPVFFTASSIWLSVAQLLSGVVIVHYIGPSEMGLWASVNLALTYAFFVLAGVQNGLSRELPYYLGANNDGMARRLAATTLFYTDGGSALALLGGTGTAAYLLWRHANPKLIYAVIAVTLLIIFKFYQNYLFVTFRSKNSFMALARVQMWQGVLMILGLGLLIFGYGGLLVRFVIVAGLSVYLMHRARPISVAPSWRTDSFWLLVKTGIPIFSMDYVANCAGTLDRVALLRFGGVEQVGVLRARYEHLCRISSGSPIDRPLHLSTHEPPLWPHQQPSDPLGNGMEDDADCGWLDDSDCVGGLLAAAGGRQVPVSQIRRGNPRGANCAFFCCGFRRDHRFKRARQS